MVAAYILRIFCGFNKLIAAQNPKSDSTYSSTKKFLPYPNVNAMILPSTYTNITALLDVLSSRDIVDALKALRNSNQLGVFVAVSAIAI